MKNALKSMKNVKKTQQMYFLHLYISSTFSMRHTNAKYLIDSVLCL